MLGCTALSNLLCLDFPCSGLFRLSFQLQGLTKFHACQYRNAVISCKGSKTSVFVIVVKSNKKVSRTSIEKYGQLEFETLTVEEVSALSQLLLVQ